MNLIRNSFESVRKNPQVIIYSLFLLAIQIPLGLILDNLITSNISSSYIIKSIIFILSNFFMLLILSFILVLMIRLFFIKSKKYNFLKLSLKNFLILILMLIVYNLIIFISYYISFFLGRIFSLSENSFSIIMFILSFIGIVSILQFISLSSFYLVKDNSSMKESIISSIKFVKKNYSNVLMAFIIFFALIRLSDYLPNSTILYYTSISELFKFIIVYPLFASFLANLINPSK